MAGSIGSGSISPSGRPSTSSKSTRRASDGITGSGDGGVKEGKNWAEGDFAYEYVQIAQVSFHDRDSPGEDMLGCGAGAGVCLSVLIYQRREGRENM